MTRCGEVVNHLLQLSLKLTSQQFVLLVGSLHPTSLIMKLSQHRSLHSGGSSRVAKPEAGSVAGLSPTSNGLPVSAAVVLLSAVTSQLKKLQCGTSRAPVESPANTAANTGLQPPDNTTAVWSTASTGPFQPPTNTTPIQSKANTTLVQSPADSVPPTNTTSVQSTTNTAPKAAAPMVHPPANSTSLQPPANTTTSVQPPANTTSVQPPPTPATLDSPAVAIPPAHLPNKFYTPTKKLAGSSPPPPPLTVSSPRPQSSTTLPPLHNTRGNRQPVRRSSRRPQATKRLVNWRMMPTSKRPRLQPHTSAGGGGGGGGRTCENCDTGTVSCHRCKSRV